MADASADPLIDSLVADFGGNYTFALELLEQYRLDRQTVDPSWREYFDRATGAPPPEPPPRPAPRPASTDGPRSAALVRQEPAVPAVPRSRALIVPAILPGDIATPLRGGAARIVENMEASLTIPTATSVRLVPVRTLEENRRLLNKHRDTTGGGKISFTHLVAWAILRALDTFPRLNDAYAELEGTPHRIQRDAVRLGVAVDVQEGRTTCRPQHPGPASSTSPPS
jgi:2-oxoglutarate dehydrogenase E1 component